MPFGKGVEEKVWYGTRLLYRCHAMYFHKLPPGACFIYSHWATLAM